MALRNGTISSAQLTRAYFNCIERLQPKLNAFITLLKTRALRVASQRDAELARGKDRGPLHGIPVVVKDNFEMSGTVTTVGSRVLVNRRTRRTATAVLLLERAGAVILGKTNMNELAAGMSGTNVYFGDVHNPWDLKRSPGGSSSGTAAAIAAGLCLGGLGTDTGGSIRVPSSWCGVTGMRPTYGLVSLHGVFPRAHSLDVAGPFARSAEDLACLLDAIAEYDPKDPRSGLVRRPNSYGSGLKKGAKGLKLGIVRDFTFCHVDPPIAAVIKAAADTLAKLGAEITELDLPLFAGDLEYDRLFTNLLLYEFHQTFGKRYKNTPNAGEIYGPVVKNNIIAGAKVAPDDYQHCLTKRPEITTQVRSVFKKVDALLTPASPISAPPLKSSSDDFNRARQFTIAFSYTGLPSIVIPCGFTPDGLPIGLQIVADRFKEPTLLRIAAAFEAAVSIIDHRPPIFCS